MILEAMLTVGEIRRPGYVVKVMEQLTAQNDTKVAELRPSADPELEARERQAAITWLRGATVRARARAAERQIRKRETR